MWADSRLPFERLDEGELRARAGLRSRLSRLAASEGEVLHASYAGPRHPNSDVENLLLYNVDMDGASLRSSTAHGVRFDVARRRCDLLPPVATSSAPTPTG